MMHNNISNSLLGVRWSVFLGDDRICRVILLTKVPGNPIGIRPKRSVYVLLPDYYATVLNVLTEYYDVSEPLNTIDVSHRF